MPCESTTQEASVTQNQDSFFHMTTKTLSSCIVDGGTLSKFHDFGDLCLTGYFPKLSDSDPPKINLTLNVNKNLNFFQLEKMVSPELMFREYWYRSGTTSTMRDHLRSIQTTALGTLNHTPSTYLDIGCNDCTALDLMRQSLPGIECWGVDPSEALGEKILNNETDYELINDFYPSSKIPAEYFDLITCTSVFYDFPQPVDALKAIKSSLSNSGIFLCEVNYVKTLIERCNFDMISHEHLALYSIEAFIKCCELADLELIDVFLNDMNGGNVVFVVAHNGGPYLRSSNVNNLLEQERDFFRSDYSRDFFRQIDHTRAEILNELKSQTQRGRTVAIYGASTRGGTVLQMFPEISSYVSCALDKLHQKHGRKIPGTGIPIFQEESVPDSIKIDTYFVLPYQFMTEFLVKERSFLESGGEMFTYRPSVQLFSGRGNN